MHTIPHAAGLLGLMVGLAACSPTLDWRDTAFPEADGAQALFPCKPDRVTRRVRLAGEAVGFALASCSAGSLTFAFSHVELADAARVAAALGELQAIAAANIGAAASPPSAARVPGAGADPAPRRLALQGRRPDGGVLKEEAVFFARGRWLFQASVVGATIDPETADTFFSGLKLPG